jgi:hypothetical protein
MTAGGRAERSRVRSRSTARSRARSGAGKKPGCRKFEIRISNIETNPKRGKPAKGRKTRTQETRNLKFRPRFLDFPHFPAHSNLFRLSIFEFRISLRLTVEGQSCSGALQRGGRGENAGAQWLRAPSNSSISTVAMLDALSLMAYGRMRLRPWISAPQV